MERRTPRYLMVVWNTETSAPDWTVFQTQRTLDRISHSQSRSRAVTAVLDKVSLVVEYEEIELVR